MASLKAALAVMVVLLLAVGWAAWIAPRAVSMVEPGVELPLRWRAALALANWVVRLSPWLAIFGVGAAALVGAAVSRGSTIAEERQLLLGWLLATVVSAAFDAALLAFLPALPSHWISMLVLSAWFGAVPFLASIVVATHLQTRLRANGSPIKGWHVVAASAVLASLGPAALLPSIGVWLYSGRMLGQSERAPS